MPLDTCSCGSCSPALRRPGARLHGATTFSGTAKAESLQGLHGLFDIGIGHDDDVILCPPAALHAYHGRCRSELNVLAMVVEP
ncbi:MAG: hypothetical protein IPM93_24950 [Candidatus Obscuribacter sp.]|nr:hypothetical protein [Candidatus Obscuribacter sp.]